jgi:hypothetical protein
VRRIRDVARQAHGELARASKINVEALDRPNSALVPVLVLVPIRFRCSCGSSEVAEGSRDASLAGSGRPITVTAID